MEQLVMICRKKMVTMLWMMIFCLLLNGQNGVCGTEKNASLLRAIQQNDLAFLKKKWQSANEQEQLAIIKQQRKMFLDLFQKTEKSPGFHPDEFKQLAMISCMSPVASPYQLKLLKFMVAQDRQKMLAYFKLLAPILPELSRDMIQYEISDNGLQYTAYNTSVLQVFIMAELIRLQIAAFEKDASFLLTDSIPEMIRRINSLEISINAISVEIKKKSLNLELHTRNPGMIVKLKDGVFFVDINKSLEQKKTAKTCGNTCQLQTDRKNAERIAADEKESFHELLKLKQYYSFVNSGTHDELAGFDARARDEERTKFFKNYEANELPAKGYLARGTRLAEQLGIFQIFADANKKQKKSRPGLRQHDGFIPEYIWLVSSILRFAPFFFYKCAVLLDQGRTGEAIAVIDDFTQAELLLSIPTTRTIRFIDIMMHTHHLTVSDGEKLRKIKSSLLAEMNNIKNSHCRQ